jgi:hypothetical protein
MGSLGAAGWAAQNPAACGASVAGWVAPAGGTAAASSSVRRALATSPRGAALLCVGRRRTRDQGEVRIALFWGLCYWAEKYSVPNNKLF